MPSIGRCGASCGRRSSVRAPTLALHAVVVTGSGGSSCAGQDLGEMTEEDDPGFGALMDVLCEFDKPLLAAVNGVASGSVSRSCSTATSSTSPRVAPQAAVGGSCASCSTRGEQFAGFAGLARADARVFPPGDFWLLTTAGPRRRHALRRPPDAQP